MAPPNWDDEFDFDDIDDPPKKKTTEKTKQKPKDDDFFDLDDDKLKLPAIAKNNKPETQKPTSAKKNGYSSNLKPRENVYNNFDEEIYEEVEEVKNSPKK
jgi:hypothetical protein